MATQASGLPYPRDRDMLDILTGLIRGFAGEHHGIGWPPMKKDEG
jgi:hypothetical protein